MMNNTGGQGDVWKKKRGEGTLLLLPSTSEVMTITIKSEGASYEGGDEE